MSLKKQLKKFKFLIKVKRYLFQKAYDFCWQINDKVLLHLPFSAKYIGGLKHELWGAHLVKEYVEKEAGKGENIAFWTLHEGKISISNPKYVVGNPAKGAEVGARTADTARHVVKLPFGRVYEEGCAVVTKSDILLKPYSHAYGSSAKVHPLFSRLFLPRTKFLKGKTLLLKGGSGYYHNIVDSVTTLSLMEDIQLSVNDFDYFIFLKIEEDIFKNIFEKFGIKRSACISFDARNRAFECEELYASTYNWNGNWFKDFIQDKVKNYLPVHSTKLYPEKIYVSRENAKMRRVVNETQLVEKLAEYGFVKILNEDYTFEEQTMLYKNARYIISTHGANLTNVIFCDSGAKVCEIRFHKHFRYFKGTYYELADAHQLEYYLLYSSEFAMSEMWDGDDEVDIVVNLQDLQKVLEAMGLASP